MSETAILIGAGVNELAAAHLLARAGRRVLVLDERGAGDEAEFEEGWVAARIVRELSLDRHGLQVRHADPWAVAPLAGGGRLELWRDGARSREAIRALSARDAQRWPEFCARLAPLARLLEALYMAPPPDPMGRSLGELARVAGAALRARRLGRQGMEDLLRLLPMPVADLLDDWFESDALKGLLGAAAIARLRHGPRAGGTALALLHRHVGSPAGVFRPPQSNARAVLGALPGIEIRRGAGAARIRVRAGKVAGVTLAGGEEIAAELVLSGADPQRSLLDLLEPGWLDPGLARAVRNVRSRSAGARVTLELDRAPDFETLAVAPSLDYLERASDTAKYGGASARPCVEASRRGSRLELRAQYAPAGLADALGRNAVRVLAEHCPEVGGARASPAGPEAPEVELALDQFLWMRPTPALARYRTPVGGLYLCGAAMHPGPGIAGAAGYLCAREALRDLGRRPG